MNKNPYDILGVSENATDDQIKAAYRELAKKYHPDSYEDSPLKDLAKEKMQEINEAYDEIQRLRREGKKYSGNTSSYSSGYTKTNYPEVRNYIKSGRFDDAETILRGIPVTGRDAEWHFLYGMINYRRGWTDQAYTYFRTACDMDPSNPEYRSVLNRVNSQRTYRSPEYNTTYNTTGGGCSSCDMCSALCCADVCCECMGGDLISCC